MPRFEPQSQCDGSFVLWNVVSRHQVFCGDAQNKPGMLQSTVTALPYANYKTEVLDSLLSVPTRMWAVANKDKMSNERRQSEYSMCLQLGCPNSSHQDSFN